MIYNKTFVSLLKLDLFTLMIVKIAISNDRLKTIRILTITLILDIN
jgi:hypothetical protein